MVHVTRQVLLIEDLMARWQTDRDTILLHAADDGLPCIVSRVGRGGRKLIHRFLLADVERWEEAHIRSQTKPESAKPSGRHPKPAG
jgi:hypothetical protein